MRQRIFGLLAIASILISCAGGKATTATQLSDQNWIIELATRTLGESPTIESNRDGSFSLCWKERETENKVPAVQFIIVRMSDHKVVEQGSVTMGEVSLTGDYEVLVSPRQGQVELARSAESNIRKIDVKKYLDVVGR